MGTRILNQIKNEPSPLPTSMPRMLLQRACACGSHTTGGECEECRRKREGTLQRAAIHPSALIPQPSEVPPIVHEVLRSPGQPLDAGTRAFMEPRFGHDFGEVRVHTDPKATASASAVNALAYTVGRDVVFGAGQYQPHSGAGRRLLAHELAHTVQQRQKAAVGSLSIGSVNTPAEHEADRIASQVWNGLEGVHKPLRLAHATGLQRLASPEIPVTPQQIAQMRALFQEVIALTRSGAIAAEEAAAISAAIAEAEAAIVAATEIAAAGATATTIGEGALGGAAALAADDVTVIGVADDVAIPFVLLAAAFAFGFALGYAAPKIAAAWERARQSVGRAVEIMREGVQRARTLPQTKTQSQTQPRPPRQPQRQQQPQQTTDVLPPVQPDVDFDEDERRGCRGRTIAQRGGNTCHDQFATLISGVTREWAVQTPEGLYADFDALGRDHVLYEIKTGYRFLLNTSPQKYELRERTINRFIDQSQNQLAVATRCGYRLVWVFNDPVVADFVDGFIQPPVTSQPFPCDEDR